jgi:hypothetical protein
MKKLLVVGFATVIAIVTNISPFGTHTALAAYHDFYNRSDSAYAINVYEGTRCRDTRHVVQPGSTYGNGISYKVNAYTKFKVGSGSYGQLIAPDTCVTASFGETITVYVYSNT